MVREVVAVVLLLLLVPASSLLGLTRAMTDHPLEDGFHVFADVWKANLWADLVFVLGTLVAAVAAIVVARQGGPTQTPQRQALFGILAVATGMLLSWAVYAVSWSLALESYTAEVFDGDGDFTGWDWQMFYDDPLLGLESAWTFTWCWGWGGLLLSGIGAPAAAFLFSRLPGGRDDPEYAALTA